MVIYKHNIRSYLETTDHQTWFNIQTGMTLQRTGEREKFYTVIYISTITGIYTKKNCPRSRSDWPSYYPCKPVPALIMTHNPFFQSPASYSHEPYTSKISFGSTAGWKARAERDGQTQSFPLPSLLMWSVIKYTDKLLVPWQTLTASMWSLSRPSLDMCSRTASFGSVSSLQGFIELYMSCSNSASSPAILIHRWDTISGTVIRRRASRHNSRRIKSSHSTYIGDSRSSRHHAKSLT